MMKSDFLINGARTIVHLRAKLNTRAILKFHGKWNKSTMLSLHVVEKIEKDICMM